MSDNTENLGLYLTDMETDGEDLFDFDRDLNQNWKKIDSYSKTTIGIYDKDKTYSNTNAVYDFDENNQLALYRSKQNGNKGHATSNTDWWEKVKLYVNINDKITNCILDIPQVVNMQLNSEVLTVKSGTKLYDASGNVATLNNDRTVNLTYTAKASCYVLISKSTQGITTANINDSRLTFNDNKVIFENIEYYLPLGIVTRNIEGEKSTIDRIFNGIGYIKNKNYLLPNVKMLIAHGYNVDGTYNNNEYVTDKVIISSNSIIENSIMFFRKKINVEIFNISQLSYLGELDYVPEIESKFQWYYNKQTRLWYSHEAGESSWSQLDYLNLTYNKANNTSSISTFRAVDFKEFEELRKNVANEIGDPIFTLSNQLKENEIWYEGAIVSRTTYSLLFNKIGTTYGSGDGSTTFQLPDFRDKAIWGSNNFGYINAGLPNITGTITADSFSITGGQINAIGSGALSTNFGTIKAGTFSTNNSSGMISYSIDASMSNSLYGANETVQPPAIKVRVKTRYK